MDLVEKVGGETRWSVDGLDFFSRSDIRHDVKALELAKVIEVRGFVFQEAGEEHAKYRLECRGSQRELELIITYAEGVHLIGHVGSEHMFHVKTYKWTELEDFWSTIRHVWRG